MKKIKGLKVMGYNMLMAGIFSFITFSCMADDDEAAPGDSEVNYQTYAKYILNGKVENENKQTIPGVQLIIGEVLKISYAEWAQLADTIYTDARGEFRYIKERATPPNKLRVKYQMVDRNGNVITYEPGSRDVDMGDLKGGQGPWYEGEATCNINIILKEKQEEDNNDKEL